MKAAANLFYALKVKEGVDKTKFIMYNNVTQLGDAIDRGNGKLWIQGHLWPFEGKNKFLEGRDSFGERKRAGFMWDLSL